MSSFAYSRSRSHFQEKALTTIKMYWINKEVESFRDYSWDKKRDIMKQNPEPGMDRLFKIFIKPNIGKFYTALIYENKPGGRLLRKYDEDGNLIFHI